MPRAFVTGAAGQDGAHLVPFLLGKGYEVHGLVHRTPAAARPRFHLHRGDLTRGAALEALVRRINPDEIYNLASRSPSEAPFEEPGRTLDVDGIGAIRLMEAARRLRRPPRVFQAGSSEMFGDARVCHEESPFRPRTPAGSAKLMAHWHGVNLRKGYGLFVANGLLFRHDSPRRSDQFVTRRITRAAARIKLGLERTVSVGNLDARFDGGFAGDYVEAMWRMLQRSAPDDYVIATGRSHSLRDFCEAAFKAVDLDWRRHVEDSGASGDPGSPRGHASKAGRLLKWKPRLAFGRLAAMMVHCDLAVECGEARRA